MPIRDRNDSDFLQVIADAAQIVTGAATQADESHAGYSPSGRCLRRASPLACHLQSRALPAYEHHPANCFRTNRASADELMRIVLYP